ncbi:DUF4097 domain-containing protein [Hymenobacter sp. RP-2-7]|uniref:DUF4097 domain-containing protein n=1 Tax=Hymenobacter polaris TaxID=2682546 RepID=A0A7Y0AC32_9BACT|nr:DUF4097 family beta strand repeat-containing protein [Hymenobacter polaris]NML64598.1 DUF4097 domain-containing protein [Hymenobacter polaris]
MNTKHLLLLAWLLPLGLHAQEFKMKFAGTQDRKVVLDMRQGDVTVEGYDGDELLITASGYHYAPPPSLASGLKPVYASGGDNTRLGLSVTPDGNNTLRIVSTSNGDGHYTVHVPRQTNVAFTRNQWNLSSDLTVRNLAGRLEVSLNSGDLRLLNMSGPVVANTVSGDVKVQFNGVPDQPCAITSVSGDVDVSLPAAAKVSLSMRSISGEIYTDFDLNLLGGNLHHVGGQTVEGRANGGGTTFSLRSVSGDIFVRKTK